MHKNRMRRTPIQQKNNPPQHLYPSIAHMPAITTTNRVVVASLGLPSITCPLLPLQWIGGKVATRGPSCPRHLQATRIKEIITLNY